MNVGLVTGSVDPERPAGSAHERRLAGAELAAEQDDVTRAEQAGDRAAERLGLGRRLRDQLDHAIRRGRAEPRRPTRARPRRGRDPRSESDELARAPSRAVRGATGVTVRVAEQGRQAREVVLERLQHRRRVERGGRVIERVEQDRRRGERHLLLLAVHARDPERAAGEELRGEVAERRDDARPHELDLAEEVRLAGGDLGLERIAILRRPALEHVREIDRLRREPDSGEQPRQQLPCLPGERQPALVLVVAGRLADDHQLGVGVAGAEDDLAPRLGEATPHAPGGLGGVRGERVGSGRRHPSTGQSRRRGGWAPQRDARPDRDAVTASAAAAAAAAARHRRCRRTTASRPRRARRRRRSA